jgi:hypothetical protein
MKISDRPYASRFVVPNLRWWIGGLLFASTVINYIDRQTLNVLAPYLKAECHWTNSDFALITALSDTCRCHHRVSTNAFFAGKSRRFLVMDSAACVDLMGDS